MLPLLRIRFHFLDKRGTIFEEGQTVVLVFLWISDFELPERAFQSRFEVKPITLSKFESVLLLTAVWMEELVVGEQLVRILGDEAGAIEAVSQNFEDIGFARKLILFANT